MNTLIYLLKDLKELTRSSSYYEQINACAQRRNKPTEEIINQIDLFEFNLGLLVKRLFEHVEAIQVSDVIIFMEHIYLTLRSIIDSRYNPDHIELRQEGLVFSYIYGLYHFIEQLNEAQLVQLARQYRLPELLVEIFVDKSSMFTSGCKQKILEALGAIADCVCFYIGKS